MSFFSSSTSAESFWQVVGQRAALCGVILLLVLCFLTHGGVGHDSWRGIQFAMCGLLGAWAMVQYLLGRLEELPRLCWGVLALFLGITVFTGLQLLPLPRGLVTAISPPWAESMREMEALGLPTPDWIPLAHSPARGLLSWHQMVACTLFWFGLFPFLKSRTAMRYLLRILLTAGVVEAVWGLVIFASMGKIDRVYGALLNPNHHAALLLLVMPLWIATLIRWQQKHFGSPWAFLQGNNSGTLAFFLLLLMVLSWGLSLSRGSLVIGLVGMMIWAVGEYRVWRKGHDFEGTYWTEKRAALVGIVALLAMLLIVPSFLQTTRVVERFGERVEEGSLWDTNRVELSRATLEALADSPLFGLGPAGANHAINRFERTDSTKKAIWTHNDPVQLVAELGILGTLVGLWFLIRLVPDLREWFQLHFREAGWSNRLIPRAALVAFVLVLIHSLVEFHLRTPLMGYCVLLVLGILLAPGTLKHSSRS